jgi:regulator of protease activity HflC (stomatin/prohibitin superfamily)
MGEAAAKKRRKFFKKPTKGELFIFFVVVILIIVMIWPFVVVNIGAGHVGVYFSRFFGGTVRDRVFGEGYHFVLPWDAMTAYDARSQSQKYNITALARGGLQVEIQASIIYRLNRQMAGELHATMGPDYAKNVIDPVIISSVRSVIGGIDQNDLYTGNPIDQQNAVQALIDERFADAPFTVSNIMLEKVILPEAMTLAISEKYVAEQRVLEARYEVLEAVEKFKQTYIDSEATHMSQALVSEGLSEAYLRYLGIFATVKLAESNNAKLVVIGDKDGLPLILNSDALGTSTAAPESGVGMSDFLGDNQLSRDAFVENYDAMTEKLNSYDSIGDMMIEWFPSLDDLGTDADLPQIGSIAGPESAANPAAPTGSAIGSKNK